MHQQQSDDVFSTSQKSTTMTIPQQKNETNNQSPHSRLHKLQGAFISFLRKIIGILSVSFVLERQAPQDDTQVRIDNLVYGGFIAIGAIIVQVFLSLGVIDIAAFISLGAFAIAIPLQAVCIFVTQILIEKKLKMKKFHLLNIGTFSIVCTITDTAGEPLF